MKIGSFQADNTPTDTIDERTAECWPTA